MKYKEIPKRAIAEKTIFILTIPSITRDPLGAPPTETRAPPRATRHANTAVFRSQVIYDKPFAKEP